MEEPPRELTRLDPRLLRLMQIHGAAAGLVVLAGAAIGEMWIRELLPLPPGLLLAAAALLSAYLVFRSPGRHYRAWGYRMDEDELQVRQGVWVRVHTVVPLDRVQHIDVAQGPIERSLGLCRLVVHTAGTLHSQVVLPGLTRAIAEAMRDEIRARIRADAA